MENAFNLTDSILLNSSQMLVATISFAMLAFIMWNRSRKSGLAREAGNAMLIASVPGLLASIVTLVMWLIAYLNCRALINAGSFDYVSFYDKYSVLYSLPSEFAIITVFLFPLLSIVAIICGRLFIVKKASKPLGIISIVYGSLSLVFFGLIIFVSLIFWFGVE